MGITMKRNLEPLLWSIALPGFGQFINKKYIKGFFLILAEIIINVMSKFNLAIVHSFQGQFDLAISVTDYQWLMFYPCLYFFSLWDAYRDANERVEKFEYLPFVFSAYLVTLGLIYSTKITVFGYLVGPVLLPMLFVIPGFIIGWIIRKIVLWFHLRNSLVQDQL